MKPINIIVADGLSASSRDDDRLSIKLKPAAPDYSTFSVVDSTADFKHNLYRILRAIQTDEQILFCGKSAGAWKLLREVNEDPTFFLKFRCAWLIVDCHYPFHADKKRAVNCHAWAPLAPIISVRQTNRYPTGAYILGARNITIEDEEVNHFNIISRNEVQESFNELLQHFDKKEKEKEDEIARKD